MKCFLLDLNKLPKILFLGRETLIPPRPHMTRVLDNYGMYVVTKGELHLNLNGHPQTLVPGDIFMFDYGDRMEPLDVSFCEYYYIHFSRGSVRSMELDEKSYMRELQNKQAQYMRTSAFSVKCYEFIYVLLRQEMHISDETMFEHITKTLQSIILSPEHKEPSKRYALSTTVASLLLELEASYTPKYKYEEKRPEKSYDTARRIAAYVEQHYAEAITSEIIEQQFYLSFDHANRVFRKVMGCTIIKYRNTVRIQYAKAKMRTTNTPIKEIAIELGFDNVHYFSRVFRQHEGISPSDYKRKFMRIMERDVIKKEE